METKLKGIGTTIIAVLVTIGLLTQIAMILDYFIINY